MSMPKSLVIVVFLSLVPVLNYVQASGQTSELNETMKKVGFSYKQFMNATTQEDAILALASLESYLIRSQQIGFRPELETQSQQGLEKVLSHVAILKALVEENKLDQAQSDALHIDELRKEYHKLHEPPSFWKLLFGK
ncbi:putative orphan protein [Pseudoalteromonas luteoviolacea B = ATCC 29581]|nr:putative orphan protein [Pseudoalteromonas luteoviolacea B = ATCC 29581]